jgi:hypothetical protein
MDHIWNTQELEQIVRVILIFCAMNAILDTIKVVLSWIDYFKDKKEKGKSNLDSATTD